MLLDGFRSYLEAGASPAAAHAFARVLHDAHDPVAALLAHYGDERDWSDHEGKRVFIGAMPPKGEVGMWWFDCCDLSLNVLLPAYIHPDEVDALSPEARARAAEDWTWFPMHPVARYQLGAFLDLAPLERVVPAAFDRARFLAGPEADPAVSLRCDEAGMYLHWFGKTFPGSETWRTARELLGTAPWAGGLREWCGGSCKTSGMVEVVSPSDLDHDIYEVEPELLEETAAPADVTFRGVVRTAWGLFTESQPTEVAAGARLLARYPRPR